MGIVLKGGRIFTAVDDYFADIRIEGEKIVAIGHELEKDCDEVVDAKGCYVLPGGIDTHTHFDLDVGSTVTADDFASGTRAAIVGGTTTILDYACQYKGETLKKALEMHHKRADGLCYCDYGIHMGITDWNDSVAEEIKDMIAAGVTSFKLYMAYKGNLQVDDGVIYKALEKCKEVNGLIGFHCENGDLIDVLVKEAKQKGNKRPAYHALCRPAEVEKEAVVRVLNIAEIVKAPVYVVHLSTKEGLLAVLDAKKRGIEVYVETCPQYLLLDDSYYGALGGILDGKSLVSLKNESEKESENENEKVNVNINMNGNNNEYGNGIGVSKSTESFEGAKYVMSPPLRKKADQDALWNGLASGEIQTIGTDHCSFNYKGQKELGIDDFSKIPNGAPGVEHRMELLYTYGVSKGRLTMNQMVEFTSTNAAKLFGIFPEKGTIAVGSDADLVVWDPTFKSVIDAKEQTQRVDYTPYQGFEQLGRPFHVLLRGKVLVRNAKLELDRPEGKYLHRRTYSER